MAHVGKDYEQVLYRDWWIASIPNRFPPRRWKLLTSTAGLNVPSTWDNPSITSDVETYEASPNTIQWLASGPTIAGMSAWLVINSYRFDTGFGFLDMLDCRLRIGTSTGPPKRVFPSIVSPGLMEGNFGSCSVNVSGTPYGVNGIVFRSNPW